MNRPKVLVTRRIPDVGLDRLVEACDAQIWPDRLPPGRSALLEMVPGMDGLLTLLSDRVDAELLDAAGPSLKVVSNFAVGYNNIDVAQATRRGVLVGNTPDVLTDATADIAAGLLIAAARRFLEGSQQVRSGNWLTWEPTGMLGGDLRGRTLGIFGMGRIGFATAKRMSGGWDMEVLYTSRSDKPDADTDLGAKRVELDELLGQSDFVSVHVDLNESTKGMFDANVFAQMKSTAVLVNTARGDIINQDDLADALRDGQIAAAGLDVTSPEPIPSDHPLVHLDNCLILPHVGSATPQTRDAMAEIAVDNLLAGLRGQPLRSQVTAG